MRIKTAIIILSLLVAITGGCKQKTKMTTQQTDSGKSVEELTGNTVNLQDTSKLIIRIDKDWSINDLVLGKSSEADFLNSGDTLNFEKMINMEFSDDNPMELAYANEYNNVYLHFSFSEEGLEDSKINLLKVITSPPLNT